MGHYDTCMEDRCKGCGGSPHRRGEKCPGVPERLQKERDPKAKGELRVGLEEKLRRLNKMYQG